MAAPRQIRLLSRRSIVSLIGVDYPILEQTRHDNIRKFYLTGAFVIAILVISFCSVFYAFDLMFDMWHAELLLSLFFALMFFNIYIFLIQTFSKEALPRSYRHTFFNLSNLSRLGFVLMIGYLIAQPIRVFSYRERLDADIGRYKQQLLQTFTKANDRLYKEDRKKLLAERANQTAIFGKSSGQAALNRIDSTLAALDETRALAVENARTRIERSQFFVKRLQLAAAYTGSGMLVLAILTIFLAPVVLIFSISGDSDYYQLKKQSDRRLVLAHYGRFKIAYTQLFKEKHGQPNKQFYEYCSDAPFNQTRHSEPDYGNEKDFLNDHSGL